MFEPKIVSLQQQFAPKSICFGCGPTNEKGLRINSFVEDDKVVAKWQPQPQHQAFVGTLNGGIIGTLLDCHCNWTAAYHLMKKLNLPQVPCTVTAEYTIKLLRPTPSEKIIELEAKVVRLGRSSTTIDGTLSANGILCATCEGVFVAVKEGHPAFHRW